MAKDEIRLSQLIQTFGPGSIVDLPKTSVMVRGLSDWPSWRARKIRERRLIHYLTKLLENAHGGSWLEEGAELELWEPPLNEEIYPGLQAPSVPAVVFPRWVTVSLDEDAAGESNRQRLERYTANDRNRRRETKSPIRWVGACKNGHAQDIDWRWFVHAGSDERNCQQDLFIEDRSSGSDPQYIEVSCQCGARRSLKDLYASEKALGTCMGRRPWLRAAPAQQCDEPLKPMTRGAINNYYSQVLRLIALPEDPDELQSVLQRFPVFRQIESFEEIGPALKFSEADVKQAVAGFSHAEIWNAIQENRRRSDAEQREGAAAPNPKEAEFELFTSGEEIGSASLNARITGSRLHRATWSGDADNRSEFIQDVVAISRLCVVSALYGFTRLEPAPSPFDENFEEITLEVGGQPLADKVRWLPAMEQFGEGFFLHIDADWFARRLGEDRSVFEAISEVQARYELWRAKQPTRSPYPGHAYLFAHSLSHMLMEQIALEAGYPSTALSERIYALSTPTSTTISKIGVLIYAAGSGSQGTLGGLLQQSEKIMGLVGRGLERIAVCGNDPICSTSPTPIANDDFSGFGAACHGCLFSAETSCEKRNMLLDRRSLLSLLST
jgi:hypothetical protein